MEETKKVLEENTKALLEIINTRSNSHRCNLSTHFPFIIFIVLTIGIIALFFCELNALFCKVPEFSFFLCVFLITIVFVMAYLWVKQLETLRKQEQESEIQWQNKLLDAYGKIIENHIKIKNKETELEIQKIENQIQAIKQSEMKNEK